MREADQERLQKLAAKTRSEFDVRWGGVGLLAYARGQTGAKRLDRPPRGAEMDMHVDAAREGARLLLRSNGLGNPSHPHEGLAASLLAGLIFDPERMVWPVELSGAYDEGESYTPAKEVPS